MDFYQKLLAAMQQSELYPSSLDLTPGKYHRFKSEGICKKKCCSYRIFPQQAGAHFLCWRRGIYKIWFTKSRDSKLPIEHKRIVYRETQILREKQKRESQKISANCSRFYFSLPDNNHISHPYITKKKIIAYCARFNDKCLVIPISDNSEKIISLQFIYPNGFKKMMSGAPSAGGMIFLQKINKNFSGVIRICEGWATGCTVKELTGDAVICATNANNIVNTAIFVRRNFIHAKGILCADNDRWGKENIGIKYAQDAAKITGFDVVFPFFPDVMSEQKPTDFNDLFCIFGAEKTLSCL